MPRQHLTGVEAIPRAVAAFSKQVARHPSSAAVVEGDQVLSYAEMGQAVDALVADLIRAGVGAGDVVALELPRGSSWIAACLAVWSAGASFASVDPLSPLRRRQDLRSVAGAQWYLSTEGVHDCRASATAGPPGRSGVAYVAFTSGSTGSPKAIKVTSEGLDNLVDWAVQEFQLTGADRCGHVAHISADPSVLEVFSALSTGCCVVVSDEAERVDFDRLMRWAEDANVTVLQLPTVFAERCFTERSKVGSVRLVFTGGERLRSYPCPDAEYRALNLYGPAEVTVVSTCERVAASGSSDLPSIGRAIDGLEAYVCDDAGNPVPQGQLGEIVMVGPGVADGYTDERQNAVFGSWSTGDGGSAPRRAFKTGDLARELPDGRLHFVGRQDRQVQVRGFRVEPAEIEVALRRHESVDDAYVDTAEREGAVRIIAYVACRGSTPTEPLLRSHLASALPQYMQPHDYRLVSSIPVASSGKVERSLLLAQATAFAPAHPEHQANEAPQGDLERELAAILCEALQRPTVGRHERFFDMGGTSLNAATFCAGARQQGLGDLTVQEVFECGTVSKLAQRLQDAGSRTGVLGCADGLTLLGGRPNHHRPLFCIHGGNGEVAFMRKAFADLASGATTYGLRAAGLDANSRPHTTVADMAAHYLSLVRGRQPEGPYRLAGYCVGGDIAYEMAQQLQSAGCEVEFVLILDPASPDAELSDLSLEELIAFRMGELIDHCVAAGFDRISVDPDVLGDRESLVKALKHIGRLRGEETEEHLEAHLAVWLSNHTAWGAYVRQKAGFDIHLFLGADTGPTIGSWQTSGALVQHFLETTHDFLFESQILRDDLEVLLTPAQSPASVHTAAYDRIEE